MSGNVGGNSKCFLIHSKSTNQPAPNVVRTFCRTVAGVYNKGDTEPDLNNAITNRPVLWALVTSEPMSQ